MRIDRNLLNWGVFFILLGGIPLAVQQGWLPDDLAWWQLWPLILIGIGIGILLRRTAVAALGGLLIAATFGVMLGGALANAGGGFPSFGIGCAGGSIADTPFQAQDGAFTGDRASVELDMGCGDLTVTTAPGSAWSLSGTAPDGQLPAVDRSDSRLSVRDPDDGADFFRDRSSWAVTLPTEPTLDLDARVNAGKGALDLDGARFETLSLSLNAGDGRIDLGSATANVLSVDVNAGSAGIVLPDGSLTGSLTVNAGSIELCAPPGVALRLRTNDNITASDNYGEAGLVEVSDNTWESPDWATATKRIDLSTTANAGSFTLDPEDGCQ
jgi:hypothetical protein